MSIVKKSIIAAVVLASVTTFTVYGITNGHQGSSSELEGNMVDIINPMYEDLSSVVMVPGSLELVNKQVISEIAEAGDYTVLVELGSEVEVGTPLIQYSTVDIDYEIQDIQLQIDRSQAAISRLTTSENEVSRRKSGPDVRPTFITDELTGEKIEVEPLTTVKELDNELLELADSKKEENYALSRLQNELEGAKEKKEQLTIKSTIDGKVLTLSKQGEGTDPYGNALPLMEIADTTQFTITGNISEKQSLEVELGHPVTIQSDTIDDEYWVGEVIDVSYFPSESDDWYGDSSGSQYPVTILITEGETERLRPGYQVYAEIMTNQQEGLAIAMEAIKYDEMSTYVLVYEEGIAVRRDVEFGFTTEYSVEIVSGLTEEDQVILDYSDMIEEGMEVTPFDYGGEFEEEYYEEDYEEGFGEEFEGEFEEDGYEDGVEDGELEDTDGDEL
ncbi:HlyD family secretion protein [Alkalihalobacillus xiaoxiensis]|uniref:HlyD family secretion protein n=1 Tax=Shouchella xiaoxiensis TaxID=766895 RepID=A0ABS2SSK2_9BACI|nr:efflux RND transporter periplasmic adaptor subunit [Shouchella xiaoxiensis]MBM7838495.1 HlyD family secretion protein [Shouchella xiaoxiensis]